MNTQQDAQSAEKNIYIQNEQKRPWLVRIPERKKHNSSIVVAGLSIGVDPSIIEYYLPQMLEATKQLSLIKKEFDNGPRLV